MDARWVAAVALVAALGACASGPEAPVSNEASGPPEIREEVVAEHASQLDDELGARPAGSQQEQIASQYVLGHLQKAGYLVRLDAVPVGNLVESSNLIAVPPSQEKPVVVVVAPYDSPEGRATGGEEAGFLLELARAFNVSSPGDDIEFAALGADSMETSGSGGADDRLGARRLINLMQEEDLEPVVIEIGNVEEGAPLEAAGPFAGETGLDESSETPAESVFTKAGFEWASVSGDPGDLGAALIDFLQQAGG